MRFLPIAAVICAISPGLFADQSSKAAKIQDLLTVTRSEQLLDGQRKQVIQMMDSRVAKDIPPGDARLRADIEKSMIHDLDQYLNWSIQKPKFIELYSQTFSESEIEGMLAFYKSPSGQAVLAKMPQLMSKTSEMVNGQLRQMIPQMNQHIKDLIAKEHPKQTAKP